MNYKDVYAMLEEGEGFEIEFKRKVSSPEKIAKTLIALANTKGGTILFGIDDDGSIIGIGSEKEEADMIEMAGKYFCDPPIEPTIEIISYRGKDIIAVIVDESDQKPHHHLPRAGENEAVDTNVYIRVNDKTVEASKEVVRVLEAESPGAPPVRITIGEEERRLFDHLDGNERITVNEFAKLVNVSHRRASRSLVGLVRAGVLRIHTHEKEDYFTRAF